ncbi:Dihydrolipoamide acetyltransferase component of pyruvate dehydrogenase complex [Rhynchospora pubera]|uniref:Dihydrolipoamide acetyltransferase component of pyruvate dehydrogenase complex n=1 Tax=Rhynchospora pubera TaxID=906938 RepID=A0AAV8EQC6_9POAL|nr:Dihydrolipoamide acetyltransferase component of pyruvate dehydrogenase complex [Rhynchospora pubera]
MAWRRLARLNLSRTRTSLHHLLSNTSSPDLSSLGASLYSQFPKLTATHYFRHDHSHDRRWYSFSTNLGQAQAAAEADPTDTGGQLVEVPLAQTGEGIAECELLKWFVQEGDHVEEFQRLCEVQSDKATIEITSRFKGQIHQINFTPGDIVKVGETLLKIQTEHSQSDSSKRTSPFDAETSSADAQNQSQVSSFSGGVLSTPSVRHLAKQHNLDINQIPGTGKDGRILKEDVLNYAINQGFICKDSPSTDKVDLFNEKGELRGNFVSTSAYEDKTIPLRGFHRAMVKSMTLASQVPHFHYLEEINFNALVELKEAFKNENKDQSIKHTFLPFLIKSLSMALTKFPLMNSSLSEETSEVILKGCHNIGVAMATEYGLVVPNIKMVQSLSVLEITKELSRLHELATHNKLNTDDITGGTITLSNIGAIGGKFGSPLLNLPEVAIIALGRIQRLPRFNEDGNIYPASVTNVTIGADHRVVDGATVARFCNEWKNLIEKPQLLLLHMR